MRVVSVQNIFLVSYTILRNITKLLDSMWVFLDHGPFNYIDYSDYSIWSCPHQCVGVGARPLV